MRVRQLDPLGIFLVIIRIRPSIQLLFIIQRYQTNRVEQLLHSAQRYRIRVSWIFQLQNAMQERNHVRTADVDPSYVLEYGAIAENRYHVYGVVTEAHNECVLWRVWLHEMVTVESVDSIRQAWYVVALEKKLRHH